MKRRRWVTPARVLLASAAVCLGVLTWWLTVSGDRGTSYAVDLTFAVTVLTFVVAVFPVHWPSSYDHARLAAAARSLARDIGARESAEQQKFLADSGIASPANVGFGQPPLLYWRTDGGAHRGSLHDVKAYYSQLRNGRLAILGPPGAGKTVLANQLLLDLIEDMPPENPRPGVTIKIPVRLSLSAFDPGDALYAEPKKVSRDLDAWIARYLSEVYGLTNGLARLLLREGWILPILDGLDEMDSAGDYPVRASAVARALNSPANSSARPVIITCRRDRYQILSHVRNKPGRETVLQDATAIEIQPLSTDEICAYLTHRFPDPAHPGSIQPRWKPVIKYIAQHSTSALAEVLASPLQLFLATTAYHDPVSQPRELTLIAATEIRSRLLGQLIPAVTDQYQRPGGGNYKASDVTRWLTTFANNVRYLRELQDNDALSLIPLLRDAGIRRDREILRDREVLRGGYGIEINLNELDLAAGSYSPRLVAGAALGLLAALPMLWYFSNRLSSSRLVIVATGFVMLGVILATSSGSVNLSRLNLAQLRTLAGCRKLARSFAASLIGGLALAIGFTAGAILPPNVVLGNFGLSRRLSENPPAIRTPGQLVRQGISFDVAVPFVTAIVAGIISCVSAVITPGLSTGITSHFEAGFAIGLTCGFVTVASSPWPRYFVATRILAVHHGLPWRPAAFLDWAYDAGLLRLSGVAVQFRHLELQEYLVASSQDTASRMSSIGQYQANRGPGSFG